MLKYKGKLFFKTPLTDEAVQFLNEWQQNLVDTYNEYRDAVTKAEKETVSLKLNTYSGINFSAQQRWAIYFAMSPMITFQNDCVSIKGSNRKGNIREAVLAYQHFFFSDVGVLKQCLGTEFIEPNQISGIVECSKKQNDTKTQWCYLFKNNQVYSIDSATIKEYEKTPNNFHLELKEDTFHEKLLKYFPPLLEYAKLKSSLAKNKTTTSASKKIKI